MKPVRLTILMTILLAAILLAGRAQAVDPPHHGMDCNACHGLGKINALKAGLNLSTVCLDCHKPGGKGTVVNAKPANPYGSGDAVVSRNTGTEHSFTGAIINLNAKATSIPGLPEWNGQHATATMSCAACHNPHNQPINSSTGMMLTSGKFLRAPMDTTDTLCMKCHGSMQVNPGQTNTKFSHPAGSGTVTMTSSANYFGQPQFSSLKNNFVLKGNRLTCSVCHKPHKGFSNPTSTTGNGDGYLGRTYMDEWLCAQCHRKPLHGSNYSGGVDIGCKECHSTHNPSSNISLVKGIIRNSHTGVDTAVSFTANTNASYFQNTQGSGICQICHTKTKYFRNYSVTTYISAAAAHGGWNGTAACTSCHSHSSNGVATAPNPRQWPTFAINRDAFSAACGGCHGTPPKPDFSAVTGNDGLVGNSEAVTGSPTTGPHLLHASTLNLGCTVCHAGNGHKDTKIDIGFSAFSQDYTGTYNGFVPVNGYTFNASNGTTTITTANNQVCSNLYCHGRTLANGSDTTPTWTSAATGDCGTCHGYTAASLPSADGSHARHAGSGTGQLNLACTECHPSRAAHDGHVNGSVQWQLNTANPKLDSGAQYKTAASGSTGTMAPSSSFGNCTNIYCHSDGRKNAVVYNAPLAAATWRGSMPADCTGCHGGSVAVTTVNRIDTGSHLAHISGLAPVSGTISCNTCHTATVSSTTTISNYSNHTNKSVDVSFLTTIGGTYSGSTTPGDAFGGCSTVYCHTDGNINNATPGVASVIPTWGVSWSNNKCANCHGDGSSNAWPTYANGGAGTTMANSHAKHVGGSNQPCTYCHNATTVDGSSISSTGRHLNKTEDVVFLATTIGGSYILTPGNATFHKTCATTTCHGTTSPAWGGITNCASCHESMGAVGTTADSYNPAHQRHTKTITSAAASAGYQFSCAFCHAGTSHATGRVTTFQSAEVGFSQSGNSFITTTYGSSPVVFRYGYSMTTNPYTNAAASPWYTGGTTAWTTDTNNAALRYSAGSCGNLWCHSNAAPLNGTNTYVTPTWTTTPLTCGSCHSQQSDANPTWSTRHSTHVKTYTTYTCNDCHQSVASNNTTISSFGNHVNAAKDIAFGSFPGTVGTYNNATATCTNLYCHTQGQSNATFTGTNAPLRNATWTTIFDCTGCHGGDATQAAGFIMTYGSHRPHITAGIGAAFSCETCHNATATGSTTISSIGNHVNKAVNVSFLTTIGGTYSGSATPGDAFGSCSTVYCHTDGNINNAVPGAAAKVATWGTVWGNNKCANCHGDGSSNAWPTYATGGPATTSANSHEKHIASNFNCQICHKATTDDGTTISSIGRHLNKAEDVVFTSIAGATGSYNATAKTCSATYCHGTAASVPWGSANGTNCASCHEDQGASGAMTNTNPAHTKHVDTAKYKFSCEFCHSASAISHAQGPASGTNPGGGDAVGAHQTAEVRFTTTASGWVTTKFFSSAVLDYKYRTLAVNPYNASGVTPVYTNAGTAWTTDSRNAAVEYALDGSCNNIWCHSNAAPLNGVNSYAMVNWNSTAANNLNCGSCHSQQSDANPTWSTRHSTHVKTYTTYTCNDCHQNVASNNTTISSFGNHVNAVKNVVFGNFAGTTAGWYTSPTAQCGNTYCHSKGTSFTAPTHGAVAWTTTITTCNACHGGGNANGMPEYTSGSPKANSHSVHVTDHSMTCNLCHNGTTTTGNTITGYANHVDKSYDLTAGGTYGGTPVAYTPTTGNPTTASTCSNISCHGYGVSGFLTTNTATWGGTLNCGSCHAFPPANGAHAMHIQNSGLLISTYGNDEYKSNTTNYAYGCGTCHPLSAGSHGNGTVDVELYNAAATQFSKKNSTMATFYGSGNDTVCGNIYCHSNGAATPVYTTTPRWSTIFNGDRCAGCHGNSPSTNAHGKHIVGLHYDDVYSGTTGLNTKTGTTGSGAGHGDANVSTTMNCNVCHYTTVTAPYNDKSSSCSTASCHDTAPRLMGTAAIANKAGHVNGMTEVSFISTVFRSKAQLRDDITTVTEVNTYWQRNNSYKAGATSHDVTKSALSASTWTTASKTCATACHNGNSVVWTASNISCNACHSVLPK